MAAAPALIAAWARSAIVPVGGAFAQLAPHEIGAPVVRALLARAGLAAEAVDAVVVGNALGAGGNPARLVALAAGLPETTPAFTIDTQCCAGLDAVAMGVGLLASGRARVVIAGGVEAWSRAPIRQHRPRHPGEEPVAYERPAFAPEPERDPDMLVSAARYAVEIGCSRTAQDLYALQSHARGLAEVDALAGEIVPLAGVQHDLYPRALSSARAARIPAAVKAAELGEEWLRLAPQRPDCSMSPLGVSPKADGAAFVLLASAEACDALGLDARAEWVASASMGVAPDTPLLAAEAAARRVLQGAKLRAADLDAIELHDAFAVQGLSFCRAFALDPQRINRRGGGLARGHPIGASGAVVLVRLLAELAEGPSDALGLAAVAAAGGLGAAALLRQR